MAFSSFTKQVQTKKLLKKQEIKLNGQINVESDYKLDKVLDINGFVQLESQESSEGYIVANGIVNLISVFMLENKQIDSVQENLTFSERIGVSDAEHLVVFAKLKQLKQQKETFSVISVQLTVELLIYGVVSDNIVCLDCNSTDYPMQTKKIMLEQVQSTLNYNLVINDDIEINDKVEKIISCYTTASVNKVSLNENYFVIDGDLDRNIIYLTDGTVKKFNKKTSFNEEVSMLNLNDQTSLFLLYNIASQNLSLTSEDNSLRATINAETTINLLGYGVVKQEQEVVSDIFSTTSDLVVSDCSIKSTSCYTTEFVSDRINVVSDQENNKRIDEILFGANTSVIVHSVEVLQNGILSASGEINQNFVCKNYDTEDIFNVSVLVPFSSSFNLPQVVDNAEVEVAISANLTNYKNRAGKDINLSYDIYASVVLTKTDIESCICDCAETEVTNKKEHNIIIYNPDKSETLFDVAKKLKISPDVILAQNPGLGQSDTLSKIVVYEQIN